jgi:hypothetical protein
MKKILLLLAAFLMVAPPVFAQTKEDKDAKIKALYENAKEAFDAKDWVIIPTLVTDADGNVENNTDAGLFIAFEKTQMFLQGWSVCGNSDTNLAQVSNYMIKTNKKGDITVLFNILGRKVRGSVIIRMRADGGNVADVVYTPSGSGETVKRYTGPVVHCNQVNYFKRANAI